MALDYDKTMSTFKRWLSDGDTIIGVFENQELGHPEGGGRFAMSFYAHQDEDLVVGETRAPDTAQKGPGWRWVLVGKSRDAQEAYDMVSRKEKPYIEVAGLVGLDLRTVGFALDDQRAMVARFAVDIPPQLWSDLLLEEWPKGDGAVARAIERVRDAGYEIEGIFEEPIPVDMKNSVPIPADAALRDST